MCNFDFRLIGSDCSGDPAPYPSSPSIFSVPRLSWGLKFLLGVGTPNMYKILKGH